MSERTGIYQRCIIKHAVMNLSRGLSLGGSPWGPLPGSLSLGTSLGTSTVSEVFTTDVLGW